MAADEDEGSQSENKNVDPPCKIKGEFFSAMHQEFESKLSKAGITYEDRVTIILSGWDHLAATAKKDQLPFAKYLYKWTLQLVLQGEWPKLGKIVKTRLRATLQRCNFDSLIHPMSSRLLPLVTDPWGHSTLKAIIAGSYVPDVEIEQYIFEETWSVVQARIDTLVESRCEELALSLLKVCMRCIKIKSDIAEMLLNSQEDHNHFVDLYFVLLYKFQKKQFLEEVRQMDILEGVSNVRRLVAKKGKEKVWKHHFKIAEFEIQIFLTSCIVKPCDEIFRNVFDEWCKVMIEVKNDNDVLYQMIRKYIQLAESSQHVYMMGSILLDNFVETHAALVTELLIRALTLDMNALEAVKFRGDKEESKEEQTRLQHQLANGFMDLAEVFREHESVARECVLTAFSLHPTPIRLDKLKSYIMLPNTIDDLVKKEDNCKASISNVEHVTDVSLSIKAENVDVPLEQYAESKHVNETLSDPKDQYNGEDIRINETILDTGQRLDNAKEAPSSSKFEKSDNDSSIKKEVGDNSMYDDIKHINEADSNCNLDLDNSTTSYVSERIGVKESFDEYSKSDNNRNKNKDEMDSMDGFFASTEHLIEQLNKEKQENTQQKDSANNESVREVHFDVLSDPQAVLSSERLEISKELCDDLAVVLSSPRWQVLSWMLDKSKLLTICEKYLRNSEDAKNLTKELKFLNIDYSQFQHLPSVEIDEFYGIEKGYEQYMDTASSDEQEDFYYSRPIFNYSSGSDIESNKWNRGSQSKTRGRRGRPPLRNRYLNSDSDSGRPKSHTRTTTSFSESEDTDFDSISSECDKNGKEFEGKRVTAISCNDRRKRLRIDATTGRVKQSHGRQLADDMRHHNHQHLGLPSNRTPTSTSYNNSQQLPSYHNKPNIKPNVVLTHYNRSNNMNVQNRSTLNNGVSNCPNLMTHSTQIPKTREFQNQPPFRPSCYQRGRYNGNWRYSGYVIGRQRENTNVEPSVSIIGPKSDGMKCSYRTREGRLVTLNTTKCWEKNNQTNIEYFRKLNTPSSKYEESFAKFLLQQKSDSTNGKGLESNAGKTHTLESSLEYLKKQGTSVILKQNSTNALVNAQKTVLNQIMSLENSSNTIIGRTSNHQLPIRAIAMPVSHNPPNLPPDKNSPPGLNRVLPKGTTVVRKSKSDTGAGPSGLNNGGNSVVITPPRNLTTEPRPAISITPSSNFLGVGPSALFSSTVNPRINLNQVTLASSNMNQVQTPITNVPGTSFSMQTENESYSPLASATVLGNVSQTLSPRLNSMTNSPAEILGGSFANVNSNPNVSMDGLNNISFSNTTTTTVVTSAGEPRAPSMLESLLRERSTPSPLITIPASLGNHASTATTASFPDPIVASSLAATGNSLSQISESLNMVTSHSNIIPNSNASPPFMTSSGSDTASNLNVSNDANQTSLSLSNLPMISNSLPSSVFSTSFPPNVISPGIGSQIATAGGTLTTSSHNPSGMHHVLLPAQFIQVQGSDGSTGLGIVHSGSLDLRLPPGTRVIKSSTGNLRPSVPVSIAQANPRPLNVLHNVKFVQNRQIVRTVVVPHSVALQGLGPQQAAQLIALSQNPGTSNVGVDTQAVAKIASPQFKSVLGQNIMPGGLVIRAVRPNVGDPPVDDLQVPKSQSSSIIQHTSDVRHSAPKEKEEEKPKVVLASAQEEGLAERLNRHYLKAAILASTNNGTQSVGTQTQTTAVKPVTGQIVNQVVMNHLRSVNVNSPISSVSLSSGPNQSAGVPSSSGLSHLSLAPTNAVSSETLEQLREFESVFEKVSNKSVKESEMNGTHNRPAFPASTVSSEESMIAAQLLSMANENPTVVSTSSYVYSIPTSDNIVTTHGGSVAVTMNTNTVGTTRLGEGTYITIPNSTPGGTLILVNPSPVVSSAVALTNVQTPQPPPAASPALSTTSSHSSIASSPSSSSSKNKNKSSKSKTSTPSSAPVTPTKPKSPPPPKVPPKPAVTKPQVEESDETKARIQAILDQYKQDLANTPQPQPAPRNRKNCPPPKNEGKSSSKKKSSQGKKPDGSANASPGDTSDSGQLPSASPSPAPLAVTPSEDSEGSITGVSVNSQFHSQDEKVKTEETISPQILQGVVVSNVKMDGSSLGSNLTTLPQGRVVQLIRHGSKVTAITTRQPYQKAKGALASGGPPPNVTIQGRINMNDLVESHLASLLAGGSATINQSSALITKLIQAQQQQSAPVQHVVVQTSSGVEQQLIQQVALQPIIATQNKTQGQVICLTGSNSTKHVISAVKSPTQPQLSPVKSLGMSSASTPVSTHSSSSASVQELPPIRFPAGEESNSSEDSTETGTAAPLPPFFTLTKQFMVPGQETQVVRTGSKQASSSNPSHTSLNLRTQTSNSASNIQTSFTKALNINCPTPGSAKGSNVARAIMLTQSAPPSPLAASADNLLDMSPVSGPSSLEGSPSLISHRLPLVTSSELRSNSMDSMKSDPSVEEVHIPPSPATLTKQLQNAYMTDAALSPNVSQPSHLLSSRSNPSPSTVQDLQLAAESRCLSPNLAHASHTYSLAGQGSRASSLSNTSNGSISRQNPSIDNNTLACLSSPSGDVYLDQAEVGLGLDNIPLVEGRPQSPTLSDLVVPAVPLLSWSPRSADSMMGNSPSLNDALTGNLTLDIQHSEDSLCDSSTGFPGLFSMEGDSASVSSSSSEDLLNSNITTTVSSIPPTSTVFSVAPSQPSIQAGHSGIKTYRPFGKRLPNHEQDHTISSTQSEPLGMHILGTYEFPRQCSSNDVLGILKTDEESNSPAGASNESTWKFAASLINSDPSPTEGIREHSPASVAKNINNETGSHNETNVDNKSHELKSEEDLSHNKASTESEFRGKRRKSKRTEKVAEDDNTQSSDDVHNGIELNIEAKKEPSENEQTSQDSSKKPQARRAKRLNNECKSSQQNQNPKELKLEVKEEAKVEPVEQDQQCEGDADLNTEEKCDEVVSRVTRGSKRRSEVESVQERKNSKSTRSKTHNLPLDQLLEDDDKTFSSLLEEPAGEPLLRSLRRRHLSGTSDTSSNYSLDRVSTPGLHDSPLDCGGTSTRRRKRRGSHDSSISSRDGSPLTVLLGSQSEGGVHTRRSSSRDHAKKARCRCCVDSSSTPTSGAAATHSNNRRTSGRISRGSGPTTSTSQ